MWGKEIMVQQLSVIIVLLSALNVACADDNIDRLRADPVTRYEFGLYRIHDAVQSWATTQNEFGSLNVSAHPSEDGPVVISVTGVSAFADLTSKAAVQKRCVDIRNAIAMDVFSNWGNPSATNVYGQVMYHLKWGSFFAAPFDNPEKLVVIGRAVSRGSNLVVFTGTSYMPECTLPLGASFTR